MKHVYQVNVGDSHTNTQRDASAQEDEAPRVIGHSARNHYIVIATGHVEALTLATEAWLKALALRDGGRA